MFEKRNQGYVDAIKIEMEQVRDDILQIFESTSLLGKEVNPLLDDIDRRISRMERDLDSIGLGWASKNPEILDMRDFIRKLNIMFNGLIKDIGDKTENAKAKGKKYLVPENRAKTLKDKWSEFAKDLKEKSKQAKETKENRENRREILRGFILPLDFDAKEDSIVNARQKERADREIVVSMVAKHFAVDEKDIRNWPDEKVLATAEMIDKYKVSSSETSGQGPRFE